MNTVLFVLAWLILGFLTARIMFDNPLDGNLMEWLFCCIVVTSGAISFFTMIAFVVAMLCGKLISFLWEKTYPVKKFFEYLIG